MNYNLQEIEENILCEWEDADFCVFKYYSKRSGLENEATRLILDFKNNDRVAVKIAVARLVTAFEKMQVLLRDRRVCRYIVAIPPSRKGSPNSSSERACQELATRFEWLDHIRAALERVESVQKSAFAGPGQRPCEEDHRRTIRYVGPRLVLRAQSILMFDDILTRGKTSEACRAILKQATACRSVFGLYLGRTQ